MLQVLQLLLEQIDLEQSVRVHQPGLVGLLGGRAGGVRPGDESELGAGEQLKSRAVRTCKSV
jgi:hypothetical protein